MSIPTTNQVRDTFTMTTYGWDENVYYSDEEATKAFDAWLEKVKDEEWARCRALFQQLAEESHRLGYYSDRHLILWAEEEVDIMRKAQED